MADRREQVRPDRIGKRDGRTMSLHISTGFLMAFKLVSNGFSIGFVMVFQLVL